jgi:hypothetical protein
LFKSYAVNDNKCVNCPAGSFGDDDNAGNPACSSSCTTGCSPCFASGLSSCFACTGSYYLQPQPGSTTCATTCPEGYYGDTNACILF